MTERKELPGDLDRDTQITYRTTAERHQRLKLVAAQTGMKMQELLDEMIDEKLGGLADQPRSTREQRERYAAIDALYERGTQDPKQWALFRDIVDDILKAVRKKS